MRAGEERLLVLLAYAVHLTTGPERQCYLGVLADVGKGANPGYATIWRLAHRLATLQPRAIERDVVPWYFPRPTDVLNRLATADTRRVAIEAAAADAPIVGEVLAHYQEMIP